MRGQHFEDIGERDDSRRLASLLARHKQMVSAHNERLGNDCLQLHFKKKIGLD